MHIHSTKLKQRFWSVHDSQIKITHPPTNSINYYSHDFENVGNKNMADIWLNEKSDYNGFKK